MKNHIKGLVFAIAMIMLAGNAISTIAHADENKRQKIILEMFEVMQYDKIIDQMSAVVGQQLAIEVKKKHPDLPHELVSKIESITGEEFSNLKPDLMMFVGVFMTKNFTEAELIQLLDFYKTPAGKKSISVVPKMTQEMSAWIPSVTGNFAQKTMIRVKAMLQENGYNL